MKKIVFILMILVLLTGCSVKKTDDLTSAERFALEYSVPKSNPFEYATIDQVLDILENGSGIIFFGNSDNEWCVETAKVLNEALEYKNISIAYYFDPKSITGNDVKKYNKLVKLLEKNLEIDESETVSFLLPDVYFVKNGKILGHNNDTATMDGSIDEALTKKNKKILKEKYLELISEYITGEDVEY